MEDLGLTAAPGLLILAAVAAALRHMFDRSRGRSGCDAAGDWLGGNDGDGGD